MLQWYTAGCHMVGWQLTTATSVAWGGGGRFQRLWGKLRSSQQLAHASGCLPDPQPSPCSMTYNQQAAQHQISAVGCQAPGTSITWGNERGVLRQGKLTACTFSSVNVTMLQALPSPGGMSVAS